MIDSTASDKGAPCTYSLSSLCYIVVNGLCSHLKKKEENSSYLYLLLYDLSIGES